jgi:phosphate transport system substrate-binding protein
LGVVFLARAQEVAPLSYAPAYAPEKPISGQIDLVGSTLMQPLATLWTEDFTKIHPEVVSKIDCQGSEESFKKLSSSPNTIALLSREVGPEELNQWSKELNKKTIRSERWHGMLRKILL